MGIMNIIKSNFKIQINNVYLYIWYKSSPIYPKLGAYAKVCIAYILVIGHFKDETKNKNRQYETTKIYYDNYHFDKFVCL